MLKNSKHKIKIISTNNMVQPQMDWNRLGNISNLDLVDWHWIRASTYACIRLLFANFLTQKMLHTCTYCSTRMIFIRC